MTESTNASKPGDAGEPTPHDGAAARVRRLRDLASHQCTPDPQRDRVRPPEGARLGQSRAEATRDQQQQDTDDDAAAARYQARRTPDPVI